MNMGKPIPYWNELRTQENSAAAEFTGLFTKSTIESELAKE
jgi:hypothetical protein